MGESLNGTCDLDISHEFKVMEEKLEQLVVEKLTDKAITRAMKDFGNERFVLETMYSDFNEAKITYFILNLLSLYVLIFLGQGSLDGQTLMYSPSQWEKCSLGKREETCLW